MEMRVITPLQRRWGPEFQELFLTISVSRDMLYETDQIIHPDRQMMRAITNAAPNVGVLRIGNRDFNLLL